MMRVSEQTLGKTGKKTDCYLRFKVDTVYDVKFK